MSTHVDVFQKKRFENILHKRFQKILCLTEKQTK